MHQTKQSLPDLSLESSGENIQVNIVESAAGYYIWMGKKISNSIAEPVFQYRKKDLEEVTTKLVPKSEE